MYVILDDGSKRVKGFVPDFSREGVPSITLLSRDFHEWLASLPDMDIKAIEGFIVGEVSCRKDIAKIIRNFTEAPIFAIAHKEALDTKLDLLASNFDDVFEHAVHVKEILAKSRAVWRRVKTVSDDSDIVIEGDVRIDFARKEIQLDGVTIELTRREFQIMEYLTKNRNRPITRAQLFGRLYGVCAKDTDETVVESHISRLRKRLRSSLGYDPISSKRYVGYQFVGKPKKSENSSLLQASHVN